jgi:hypothetical protein
MGENTACARIKDAAGTRKEAAHELKKRVESLKTLLEGARFRRTHLVRIKV